MSWTKNLSIILMINNKGQLWVSSIKNFLDRQGIYSALLISLMGEADGLCTESYKMGFTFQSNFFMAINQRLIVEYIYDKVTNFIFQNIISLHGEIVKSVFFVKSVRLTVSSMFPKICFPKRWHRCHRKCVRVCLFLFIIIIYFNYFCFNYLLQIVTNC